jgi:hypothetical protein
MGTLTQSICQDNVNEALRSEKRKAAKLPELHVTIDTRTKPNKYTRIVRMEPMYYEGHVFYNIDEIHNPDMIEGNNQVKGIEPGYKSPDDAPDADEGAWYELDKHDPERNASARVGHRSRATQDEIFNNRKSNKKHW